MSLFKLPFLMSITWGINTTLTRPQPPALSKEQVPRTGLEIFSLALPATAKMGGHYTAQGSFWVVSLCEASVILANIHPSHPLSSYILHLLVKPSASADSIHFSPLFFVGFCLNLMGALIRKHCYRTLGPLFTFELSIREGHRLVTTGAYSIVRHPSYTGVILSATGVFLCHLSGGSWLIECSGLLTNSWLVSESILGCFTTFMVGILLLRISKEDALLKEQFGKQWEQWAVAVPYKLFPGVL